MKQFRKNIETPEVGVSEDLKTNSMKLREKR